MRRLLFVVLFAAACAGSQEPKPAAGPTCPAAAAKLTAVQLAMLEERGAGEDTLAEARADAEAVEPHLAKACTDDRWSKELVQCIDATPALQVSDRCGSLITPAQQEGILRARAAAKQSPAAAAD
jgi:hypothetical protein